MARVFTAPGTNRHGVSLTPATIIRVPVSTVAGEVIYREIDLRANGDDPLMRWMRGAFDWDITNLKWDEQFQQPREVTWRGGTLWGPGLGGNVGEVEIRAASATAALPTYVNVRAPVHGDIRGTVKVRGFTWTAMPGIPRPTNALWCVNCQKIVVPEDAAAEASGPYRSAGGVYPNCVRCGAKPLPAYTVTDGQYGLPTRVQIVPPTLLSTLTAGSALIDDAFKQGIDKSIRQALDFFVKYQKLR